MRAKTRAVPRFGLRNARYRDGTVLALFGRVSPCVNNSRLSVNLRAQRLTGSTHVQSLVLLATVVAAGAAAFPQLGDAFESVVVQRTDSTRVSLARAPSTSARTGYRVELGSRSNASVLSNIVRLTAKAEQRMEDLLAAKPYRIGVTGKTLQIDPAKMIPQGLSAAEFEQRIADVSHRVRNGGSLASNDEIVTALGGSTPLTQLAADVLIDARNVQRELQALVSRDDVPLNLPFPNDVNFDPTTTRSIALIKRALNEQVPFFRSDGPVARLLDGYVARRTYFDEAVKAATKGERPTAKVPESFSSKVMSDAEIDEYATLVDELAELRAQRAAIQTGGPEWEAALSEAIAAYRPEVQEDLRVGFRPLAYPELARQSDVVANQGIIFYGPPGTGKTFLAKNLANLLTGDSRRVRVVKGGELTSKYVGETGQNILELAEWAKDLAKSDPNTPVAIVLDEIDALLPDKTATSTTSNDLNTRGTALAVIEDLLKDNPNVLIFGASNNPTKLDSALTRDGRIGTQVEIAGSDAAGREVVFAYHLSALEKLGQLASDVDIKRLAAESGDISFATIEAVVKEAKRNWFNSNLGVKKPKKLSQSFLTRALNSRAQAAAALEPPTGSTVGFTASIEDIRRAKAYRDALPPPK